MPKRSEARPTAGRAERDLARRIERLRTGRDWSYETLAREMTSAGCPITKAAVYAIERGTPQRRITVDEMVALADVFGLSVNGLLEPVELVDQRRAQELIDGVVGHQRQMGELAQVAFENRVALFDLAVQNAELFEYVGHRLASGGPTWSIEIQEAHEDDHVAEIALLRMAAAIRNFWSELQSSASLWARYRAGLWSEEDEAMARAELEARRAESTDRIEETSTDG